MINTIFKDIMTYTNDDDCNILNMTDNSAGYKYHVCPQRIDHKIQSWHQYTMNR